MSDKDLHGTVMSVKMVVPGSGAYVQQVDNNGTGSVADGPGAAYQVEPDASETELEEVHKLQELVRRLEVQNQGSQAVSEEANSNITTAVKVSKTAVSKGVTNTTARPDHNVNLIGSDLKPSPGSSSSSEDGSLLQEIAEDELEKGTNEEFWLARQCGHYLSFTCGKDSERFCRSNQGSLPQNSSGSETRSGEVDQSALDAVEVLDLEECDKMEDEDSWLYVSPKKRAAADEGPESPLKWCRQVLDHRSPETEAACHMLLNRLDQANRWRNAHGMSSQSFRGVTPESSSSTGASLSPGYQKPTSKTTLTGGSSGYLGVRSALSSQSSVDSELSTSDDSISLGYKLQDLTDVQIMARLQEESLRQDYASSSASASRRSSAASLQSLRRGTYSDQECDACSLEEEDEDKDCHSLPRRLYGYSSSKGDSPHRQSPISSADYRRIGARMSRVARRPVQGPSPELLKFANKEEKLRHSMPDLAPRTSLRTLEALRNSRSMEANMQGPASLMSSLPCSAIGNQSLLPSHLPVMRSMSGVLQPHKRPSTSHGATSVNVQKAQPRGPSRSRAFSTDRVTAAESKSPLEHLHSSQVGAGSFHRGRRVQPMRRSLGLTKPCSPFADESWKEGCY